MLKDPYGEILAKLTRNKVHFIVIGVSGINYYAGPKANLLATRDYDILVEPAADNVFAALRTLERGGYLLQSNGEPLGSVDRWLTARIIERQAVVSASREPGLAIDIVLQGGGFSYERWLKGAKNFLVNGVRFKVGAVQDLIAAKENANREKDRTFLAIYKIQLKEMVKRADKKSNT